jgi:hypothetical protein
MKARGCIVMVMGAILSGVHVLVTVEDEKSVLFSLQSRSLPFICSIQVSYVDSDVQSHPVSAITRLCFKHDDEDILMAQQ